VENGGITRNFTEFGGNIVEFRGIASIARDRSAMPIFRSPPLHRFTYNLKMGPRRAMSQETKTKAMKAREP
jgi:hypothetical protein